MWYVLNVKGFTLQKATLGRTLNRCSSVWKCSCNSAKSVPLQPLKKELLCYTQEVHFSYNFFRYIQAAEGEAGKLVVFEQTNQGQQKKTPVVAQCPEWYTSCISLGPHSNGLLCYRIMASLLIHPIDGHKHAIPMRNKNDGKDGAGDWRERQRVKELIKK